MANTPKPLSLSFQIPTDLDAYRKRKQATGEEHATVAPDTLDEPLTPPTGRAPIQTPQDLLAALIIEEAKQDAGKDEALLPIPGETQEPAPATTKSIEIDTRELGTAKTVQHPVTPVPPRPVTAEQEPAPAATPPPALYTGIKLAFEPKVAQVGMPVSIKIIGSKIDGTREEIALNNDRASIGCEPKNSGNFFPEGFIPSKDGVILFAALYSDAGGAQIHEISEHYTVHPSQSVSLSNSMQNVVSPAATPPKPVTVSDSPLEKKFFGERPKAQTMGGSPIYPLAPTTETEPATESRRRDVQPRMEAVTEKDVKRGLRRQKAFAWMRRHWKWLVLAPLALLFGAGVTMGAITAYFAHQHAPATTAETAIPTTEETPATEEAVTDATAPTATPTPATEPSPTITSVVATVVRHTGDEPGLTGVSGTRVTVLAREAFPRTCRTGWTTRRTDDVHFNCGPGERQGANVCACDATGTVP